MRSSSYRGDSGFIGRTFWRTDDQEYLLGKQYQHTRNNRYNRNHHGLRRWHLDRRWDNSSLLEYYTKLEVLNKEE